MQNSFPSPADAEILLNWFSKYAVPYPWSAYHSSKPVNAYQIWVSEVMLQQTTVTAVLPRYTQWMNRFPNMQSLAEARQDEVYREWEGLGYYSRARNMHSAARESCEKYGGKLPRDMTDLQSLPGVGRYIAAAIASFAWDERMATVDANIRRIVQRVEAAETWTRSLERGFKTRLESVMPDKNPGRLNATLMQFGQQCCLSRRPLCADCPIHHRCGAMQSGQQENIPVRKRKQIIQKRTELAILCSGQQVWLVQRTSGIGKGLWVFPPIADLRQQDNWIFKDRLETVVHTYTRYRDTLVPYVFGSLDKADSQPTSNGQWVLIQDIDKYPMPTAYRRIAELLPPIRYEETVTK